MTLRSYDISSRGVQPLKRIHKTTFPYAHYIRVNNRALRVTKCPIWYYPVRLSWIRHTKPSVPDDLLDMPHKTINAWTALEAVPGGGLNWVGYVSNVPGQLEGEVWQWSPHKFLQWHASIGPRDTEGPKERRVWKQQQGMVGRLPH
jgi:hypothetical protein